MTKQTTLPITGYPKSMLTTRQQGEVRSHLMRTATKVANQLDDYVDRDAIKLPNGVEVKMSPARLQAYRLILERTIPTLTSTEIKHKSALESMGTDALVARLAALVKQRPELQVKLLEAMGHKVIEATAVEVEGEVVAARKCQQAEQVIDRD